jgi:hypothetical protein
MIHIQYPWLTVQSLIERKQTQTSGAQSRHAKGSVKGGQFARKPEVGAGMPGPVKVAREEFLAMNRNRVALAKAKKRLSANPGDPKYKDKVGKLESAYQGKKLEFEAAQRVAEKQGYQVNKLGKWTNQQDQGGSATKAGPDLENMSQTELQALRDRINGMLGESGSANQALATSKPGVIHGHVVKAYGTDPNTVYEMRYEVR